MDHNKVDALFESMEFNFPSIQAIGKCAAN
jgi:hypothetical protein